MKILQLKFSNLNSLAGDWTIDFSNPAFTSSGIFLITGPTGSGKTTVLDAICLALYGKTPRLGKVTKTNNHIMTRHTGECSAEVVFESQKGRFVCHWNQRRAKNKPDGELQPPQHEISRADTKEILASKINQVQEIVKEVTGMDYDQFTRSILLAQGGFAAFLQAGADERAPILEQITGTAIYSKLSEKTYERYTSEREKLEQVTRECDLISILSPEEKESIEQQIEELRKAAAGKDVMIIRTTEAIQWIETLEKLRSEIDGLETDAKHLDEKKAAFEPSRIALLAAQKAASFQGLYAPLELKRETLHKDTRQYEETARMRDSLKASLPDVESLVLSAKTEMDQAEREREEGYVLINEIRTLDKQIREKESELHKEKEELKGLQDLLAGYTSEQELAEKKQQTILREKSDAARYIDQNARDAVIRDIYSGTEEKIHQILDEMKTIGRLNKDCSEQKRLVHSKRQDLEDLKKDREKKQQALQVLEDQQKIREGELEKILSGTTIGELRQRRDDKKVRIEHLNRLKEILTGKREISANKEALSLKRDDLIHYLQSSGYEKERLGSDLKHREELLTTKRTAAFLAAKVRDLATERNQLIDGEPCPLCGSLHHPFVTEQEIKPDEIISDFVEEEKKIKDLTRELTSLTAIIAEKEGELRRCTEDITECDAQLNELNRAWKEGAELHGIHAETDERTLESCIKSAASELGSLEATLRTAEQYDEQIKKASPLISTNRETLISLEKNYREKEFEIISGETRIGEIQELIAASEAKISTSFLELQPVLADLGCSINQDTNMPALLLTLKNRQKRFQEQEDRIKSCEVGLQELHAKLSGLIARISEKTNEITRTHEAIKEKELTLHALKNERKNTFGEKDTDCEEKCLAEAVKKASEIFETRQKEKNDLSNRLQSLEGLLSDLEKRISEAQQDISSSLDEFLSHIRQAGFQDEEAYTSALMKQEEMVRLEKVWEDIRTEETRIRERKISAETRYVEEQKKNLTTKPALDLKADLEELQKQKDLYIADIGKNQEKLIRHEEMVRQQREKIAIRDARQREVNKWHRLNELIGSADGKKFRVFAQGLTFCILLSHANQHLQRMTDRYILIQDKDLPLDMQVIDTWQGGVVRSVKNLSGGEIFMVSLALALGLSHMASQNVRVDSLFLDEGFGTLDDDALETALSTLSGLEQEGKLIGVISHVSALKERIPVRISIEKGSNGRSTILLPYLF